MKNLETECQNFMVANLTVYFDNDLSIGTPEFFQKTGKLLALCIENNCPKNNLVPIVWAPDSKVITDWIASSSNGNAYSLQMFIEDTGNYQKDLLPAAGEILSYFLTGLEYAYGSDPSIAEGIEKIYLNAASFLNDMTRAGLIFPYIEKIDDKETILLTFKNDTSEATFIATGVDLGNLPFLPVIMPDGSTCNMKNITNVSIAPAAPDWATRIHFENPTPEMSL